MGSPQGAARFQPHAWRVGWVRVIVSFRFHSSQCRVCLFFGEVLSDDRRPPQRRLQHMSKYLQTFGMSAVCNGLTCLRQLPKCVKAPTDACDVYACVGPATRRGGRRIVPSLPVHSTVGSAVPKSLVVMFLLSRKFLNSAGWLSFSGKVGPGS